MRTLQRRATRSELSGMVERTLYFNELSEVDLHRARRYWQFIQKTYAEQGYEPSEVFELVCAADEVLTDLNEEIEEMTNG